MRKKMHLKKLGVMFATCAAMLFAVIVPAKTAFAASAEIEAEAGIAEEAFAETEKKLAGDALPIYKVSLGFAPPVPGTRVSQTAAEGQYTPNPSLALTIPAGANYALAEDGAWYVSDPNSKTPLTGEFTLEEGETYYAMVHLSPVGEAYFTNSDSLETSIENAFVKRRSIAADKSIHICFSFSPAEDTQAQSFDFFAVWLCDTSHSHNLGGSVTMEAVLPDGSAWEENGKTVSISTNQMVPAGSAVKLTAVPDEEYVFDGWYPANVNKTKLDDPHYLSDKCISRNPVLAFTGNPVGEKQAPYVCAVFAASAGEVESISLNKTKVTLKVGKTAQLSATVFPEFAEDAEVTWKSEDTGIVKVGSASGKIKGIAPGTTNVRAETANGTRAVCKVTVKGSEVTDVTINKTSVSTNVGLTVQLKATATPSDATDTSLTWTSSNAKVATVSANGLVTAVRCGSCFITATAASGVDATCKVTVAQKYAYELSKDGAYRFLSNTTTIKKLKAAGWSYKKAFRVAAKSTIPVYEIYNKTSKSYSYTTNKTDAVALKKAGNTVNVAFYACKTKTTPVYALCGKDGKTWYYTTSKTTVKNMKKKGWTYKGIAWYAELATLS